MCFSAWIACPTGYKSVEVVAWSRDRHLFAHRVSGRYFNISHRPTGLAILKGIPTLQDATAQMARLSILDWEFDHPSACPSSTKLEMKLTFGKSFIQDSLEAWNNIQGQ